MDLHQFNDWLASTAFSQSIQISPWAIPTIQIVHILALALTLTAGVLISARYAGISMSADPLPEYMSRQTTRIWQLLVILLASGTLLIIAEPGRTLGNPVFYAKMAMLIVVIAVTIWLASAARSIKGKPGPVHLVAAGIAVLLWVGIIFAGRLIAYVEAY